MNAIKQIEEEIGRLYAAEAPTSRLRKRDLVTKVAANHSDVQGSDADLNLSLARWSIQKLVEKCWREHTDAEAKDRQYTLPGFEHVRVAYFCEVEGERISVPVRQMTLEQFEDKIAQLGGIAAGAMAHRDELERLKTEIYGNGR